MTISRSTSGFGKVLRAFAALAGLGVLGCDVVDPRVFDDIAETAPVIAIGKPDGYAIGGFGRQLTSFEGTIGGKQVSRLLVSAGENTPASVYVAWDGERAVFGAPRDKVCGDTGDCRPGFGTGIAGVARLGLQEMCVIMPSTEDVYYKCESSASALMTGGVTAGERFGSSIAALPDASALGAAIVGAPGARGGGKIYTFSATAAIAQVTGFDMALLSTGTFGDRISLAEMGAMHHVMLAVTTRAGSMARVVVAEMDTATSADVRACLDMTSPVFGNSVLVRDLDRDGAPEVIVGVNTDPSTPDRASAVDIYPGTGLPTARADGSCQGWGSAAVRITCPELSGVACVGSSFGSSLAAGDVDGDGHDELVVGAPTANAGATEAGAVYVLPGRATGFPTSTGAVVLQHRSSSSGAHLGTTVTTVRTTISTQPHAEIAAGAPGANKVYVFLCSGLGDDTQARGNRCLPAPPAPM